MAQQAGADLVALHCQVPDDVAAARLTTRAPGASDADLDVATTMAATEPPWPEAVVIDTSGSLEAAVVRALAAVRPYATSQAPVFRRPYMEPD
jgi:predicted kinase